MIFRISQNPSINGEKPQAEAFLRSLSSEKCFGLRFLPVDRRILGKLHGNFVREKGFLKGKVIENFEKMC